MDSVEMNLPIKVANFGSEDNAHDMETNSHLVSDSSEYTDHFLADLTADPLVLSSFQVSSVLSELEPSQLVASCSSIPVVHAESTSLGKTIANLPNNLSPRGDRCTSPAPTNITLSSTLLTPANKRHHDVKYVKLTLGESSWYRCSSCPFLATTQELISSHYVHLHVDSFSAQLRCLNCEVNFDRLQNLKHHYVIDHLVALTDLPNLTKITLEANRCWRAREKEGKKEDGTWSVDSVEAETLTAEDVIEKDLNVYSDLIAEAIVDLDVQEESSPPPPLPPPPPPPPEESPPEPEQPPTEGTPLFNFVMKFSEGSKKTTESRLKEEEAKKAEIKAEKEEKAIWKCTVHGCFLKFTSEDNLDYHRVCHENGSSQWKCPECYQFFSKWSELAIHLWRGHEVDIDLYSCDICDYKTNNLSKLMNLHRRTHGNDRPFLCDSCGKGFKSNKQLSTHKAHHNKSKKPPVLGSANCTVCSRKFTDMRILRHHMDTVHRGLKPYVCQLCDYSASSFSSVKMHMRSSHTGEKPYACSVCRYRTADHNSLRRHKMRHSGAKHYKCPHCSYASIQSTTFKDHLKKKHPGLDGGLMFCCSFCSFRTVNNKIFLVHVSSHTSGNPEKAQTETKATDSQLENIDD